MLELAHDPMGSGALGPVGAGVGRRLATVLVVVTLLVVVIEGWAPRMLSGDGGSAARAASTGAAPSTDSGVRAAEAAGIDVDGIVESASHTLAPVAGNPGAL